jgi:hypothetical protein
MKIKHMKKIMKKFTAIILICIIMVAYSALYAQGPGGVPDDPSVGNSNGAVGHPVGGGAPVGTGACILLGLAIAYGAISFSQLSRKKKVLRSTQSSD